MESHLEEFDQLCYRCRSGLHRLWETRKDWLELVDNLLLNGHVIRSCLVVRISWADSHVTVSAPQQDHIRFPWQACATTPIRVSCGEKTGVDACQDVLELGGVAAPVVFNLGKVDIEESVIWQIWFATVNNGRSDIERKIGIHLAVEGCRCVPSGWITSLARERDSWNFRRLCCVCSSAYSSRKGELHGYVTANIWASQRKFGFGTIPKFRSNNINAVFDGSDLLSKECWSALYPIESALQRTHRVRVDVVQAWICCVSSLGWASSWAGGVNATIGIDSLWSSVGRSFDLISSCWSVRVFDLPLPD